VTAASFPFLASDHDAEPIDLGQYGYTEQEYLVSGRANVYSWPDLKTLTVDTSGPYTTRILIRRPLDPARFSGNVRIEPFNPTAGHDLDAEWEIVHDGFMRNGDAYVGITVKPVTITAQQRPDWLVAERLLRRRLSQRDLPPCRHARRQVDLRWISAGRG